MAKSKTRKSKASSVRDLPAKAVDRKKGSAVKGGIVVTKKTDMASPGFFKNA